VTIGPRTSLAGVAFIVGDALRRAGIDATLTGGSCATVHSDGAYTSRDIDFVLSDGPTAKAVDTAMAACGFRRDRQQYAHRQSRFVVEFVPGPIAIGEDLAIRPVLLRRGTTRIRSLSATDSCRDRLAGFYHWADRESLAAALAIGRRRRLNLRSIENWSAREGASREFQEFKRRLAALRKAR